MATTTKDTTDNKPRTRTPRPRSAAGPAEPKGYAKARADFEARAQDWLLARQERTMTIPDDLHLAAARGVPCRTCGALIYRHGDAGHTIEWIRTSGTHWAAGITAAC